MNSPEAKTDHRHTKILASTLLAATGASLVFVECRRIDSFYGSDAMGVAMGLLVLGLWLLAGAWTGRAVGAWLRAGYRRFAVIGVEGGAPVDAVEINRRIAS